ncbi:Sieve element occlusion [Parasponia andersonii]|uniref:Sieve element occlusion n=1 Tax=Parasponia andersonii TaxID=3476 RepID=A0A2P5D4A0_PARAD|nr:Sieve element occlusion [Parasponia andersonii]
MAAVRNAHNYIAGIFGATAARSSFSLKPSSEYDDQRSHHGFVELNPFNSTDDILITKICSTHINTVSSFDYSSLFAIVKNILERSTEIVDEIVQNKGNHLSTEKKALTPINTNFNAPLCSLRQIVCEIMSCDNQCGPEAAHKTTMSILSKLSTNSWEAKAVLALAAFAMEYGDFSWLFYQTQVHKSGEDDQEFVRSLGTLKRVFVFANSSEPMNKRQSQAQFELKYLNDLIRIALQVIETFFKVVKLSAKYDLKGQSALPITIVVYWIIITVVACATTVTSLTCEGIDKTQDLHNYSAKLGSILEILTERLNDLKIKKEEADRYWALKTAFENPTDNVEILNAMFLTQENVVPLIDCHTNTTIDIEELRGLKVFLLISGLDISRDDIFRIEKVHKKIEDEKVDGENVEYKIVWIPIVENWTSENQKEFERVRSKMKWYAVKSVSQTVGIRFIQEEWHFKGKTTFVVMNQQGKVENSDAFPLICLGGAEAFPFDEEASKRILEEINWLKTVISKMEVEQLKELISDEERHIFLYGGTDQEWIKNFEETVKTLVENCQSEVKISWFCVGKTEKERKDTVSSEFWSGVEHLFFTKVNNKKSDFVTQEIQKLLSYKYEEGWVLVSKGSVPVKSGHGFTILKALQEFTYKLEETTEVIGQDRNFTEIFLECHEKVVGLFGEGCCRLHIQGFHGKQLEEKTCAVCSATMEMMIVYECCHKGSNLAAHR